MASIAGSAEIRALSSVFIGNVTLDVTEDQLKDLFSEVGQVVNFSLFCDKNTGKSKGFAFCEYKEPELAISATRNLGGYDLKGQLLRVDIATSEKCRQELERLQGSITQSVVEASESIPEKAPEEISKAVASLPPEQMFELMKQMKMCIENNPQEARNLLLQNPQLAYALLQAQVIMRIVDPQVAIKILNRSSVPAANLDPDSKPNVEQVSIAPSASEAPTTFSSEVSPVVADPVVVNTVLPVPQAIMNPHIRPLMNRPPMMPGLIGPVITNQFAVADQDLRTLSDQDLRQMPPLVDRDMRAPLTGMVDKDMRIPLGDQDFRSLGVPDNRPFDPRFRNMAAADVNRPVGPKFDRGRPVVIDPRTGFEARNVAPPVRVEDPRKAATSAATLNSRLSAADPALRNLGSHPAIGGPPSSSIMPSEEQEKAALIMQVLQLTDQQISMLPPEQRQSIMVLKEQLARSQTT